MYVLGHYQTSCGVFPYGRQRSRHLILLRSSHLANHQTTVADMYVAKPYWDSSAHRLTTQTWQNYDLWNSNVILWCFTETPDVAVVSWSRLVFLNESRREHRSIRLLKRSRTDTEYNRIYVFWRNVSCRSRLKVLVFKLLVNTRLEGVINSIYDSVAQLPNFPWKKSTHLDTIQHSFFV